MNRRLKIVVATILVSTALTGTVSAAENRSMNMYIGEVKVKFNSNTGYPRTENGSTLIPLSLISQYMGYNTQWTQESQKVTIKKDDTTIILTIGSNKATINGRTIVMDTKAQVYNNRTYIPLRFVTENMGATVEYKKVNGVSYVYLTLPTGETITVPEYPTTGMGTLEGTATDNFESNMQEIREYFGEHLHSNTGLPSFNPLGGALENTFVDISTDDTCEVKIKIRNWDLSDDPEVHPSHQLIKPVSKEIFNFYLPVGGDKLYQLIEDGFNGLWPDSYAYLNKDIQNTIGSDGRKVVIEEGRGYLLVKIGYKK